MKARSRARHGQQWGPWTYDAELQTLTIKDNGWPYEIPVDEIKADPTELPDWLNHLADKNWITPTDLGHFVYALNDILELRTLKHPTARR